MKIEKLLGIVSDSARMPGWNDTLSFALKNAGDISEMLDDDDLALVAGGTGQTEQNIDDPFKRDT